MVNQVLARSSRGFVIPIAAVPAGATTIHAARCDTPTSTASRCAVCVGVQRSPADRITTC